MSAESSYCQITSYVRRSRKSLRNKNTKSTGSVYQWEPSETYPTRQLILRHFFGSCLGTRSTSNNSFLFSFQFDFYHFQISVTCKIRLFGNIIKICLVGINFLVSFTISTSANCQVFTGRFSLEVLKMSGLTSKSVIIAKESSSLVNFILKCVNIYTGLLKSRPLQTKAVTSAIIAGMGNVISQLFAVWQVIMSLKLKIIYYQHGYLWRLENIVNSNQKQKQIFVLYLQGEKFFRIHLQG